MLDHHTGQVVAALAGRDKGRFFVITEVSEGFVFLADGDTRKIASAKKKNKKHVSPTREQINLEGLTDSSLRSLLARHNKPIV